MTFEKLDRPTEQLAYPEVSPDDMRAVEQPPRLEHEPPSPAYGLA
jgi:hypothetical protein